MEYEINTEILDLKQPKMNSLPLLSLGMDKVIEYFKFDKIIEIYKHVLLETRVIFFSKNIALLNIFTETFANLIYPMRYINQVIPVVPLELFSLIEAEALSMLGINLPYTKNFFETNNLDMQDFTYVVVDIDNGSIEQFNEVSQKLIFPLTEKGLSEEIPDLPRHYKSKFTDVLKNYLRELKDLKSNSESKETKENFNKNFRSFFLNFLVSILQEYGSYVNYAVRDVKEGKDIRETLNMNTLSLINTNNPSIVNSNSGNNTSISNSSQCLSGNPLNPFQDISTMFRVEEFINNQNPLDKPFYKKLFGTKLFHDFIYRNLFPKNAKDKLDVQFFDECIKEKNGRKIFSKKSETPFLKTSMYEEMKKYEVKVKKDIEKSDICQIMENKNLEKAIKYGQEIVIEKNDIFFQYSIFPKMLFPVFFSASKKNYHIPPSVLSEDIDNVNAEMLKLCKLSKSLILFNNIIFFIIIWLYVSSYKFTY